MRACDACDEHDPYCQDHRETCTVDGETLCADHANHDPVTAEAVCDEHLVDCELCQQAYAETSLKNGRCRACRNIDGKLETLVPDKLADDIGRYAAGANERYLVIYSKALLSSNEVIVVDRETDEIVNQRSVGFLARLKGVFS
jgi:hypothetical protein